MHIFSTTTLKTSVYLCMFANRITFHNIAHPDREIKKNFLRTKPIIVYRMAARGEGSQVFNDVNSKPSSCVVGHS